jgi:nitroreductase / dihydropteridine reductase
MSPDQQLSWAQRMMFLAVSNAINGAKSLGFDSCPMEGFNAAEYSKILNLPENLVPTALVTIGYAADTPRPKFRLPKEEVFF